MEAQKKRKSIHYWRAVENNKGMQVCIIQRGAIVRQRERETLQVGEKIIKSLSLTHGRRVISNILGRIKVKIVQEEMSEGFIKTVFSKNLKKTL
jgi:hypothetical protein